jgi:hypothetical protein
MPTVINGTTGITFTDNTVQNTAAINFRNRIINGAMVIDQRNAGASVTQGTGDQYPVDRFLVVGSVASKFTAQRSTTVPAGFINSIICTSSSAYSVGSSETFVVAQRIEGFNVADLGWGAAGAQSVTLSFWVRSSLTGTFGGALRNSATDRSYPFSYTVSAVNTWEQKTITIAGDTTGTWLTDNGIGINLTFSLGTGSTLSGTAGAWASANYISATAATSVVGTNGATFYITGVQLERSSTASSFDFRSIGQELALCQRYYEKSYNQATVPGTATDVGYSAMNNPEQGTNVYVFNIDKFAVVKRATPTLAFWDLAGNSNRITNYTLGGLARSDNNNSVYSYQGYQQNAVMINVQNASTAGTYQWTASSEL